MPLIIVTGLPCSGKTHRARQIAADFESRISKTSLLTSQHAPANTTLQYLPSFHASVDPLHSVDQLAAPTQHSPNPRDLVYTSAREEKTARAEEFSAIKRALTKSNIVVADSPNYIKGFRYQLWCEAKAVGARSVVVHVAAREDECKVWNDQRIQAQGWSEIMQDYGGNTVVKHGSKAGTDTAGSLKPESHTALYGDRVLDESVGEGLRSRSSSMGGDMSEDGKQDPDTMTLKSLYISGREPDGETDTTNKTNGRSQAGDPAQPMNPSHQNSETPASADPPSPLQSLPYAPSTLISLSMRYEPPSPFTRWDTPLFTIPSTDAHPPYQAIWDALFPPPARPTRKTLSQLRPGEQLDDKPKEVRRHAATVLPKATGADTLQILETATADVVKILQSAARDQDVANGEGGSIIFSVPEPQGGDQISLEMHVPLNTVINQPVLQRLRRKYTQIQRGGIAHGQGHVSGRAQVIRDFSRFLEMEWNAE